MFTINLQSKSCDSLRLDLQDFVSTYHSLYYPHTLLSLLNRARNKQTLLKTVKLEFLGGRIPLMHASRLFVRFNSVYKQASIERQAVKRRDLAKERPASGNIFEGAAMMQDHETLVVVMQHLRMSRVRACTGLSGTVMNGGLMEYTPSNRVLSGEVIVFQNEMIEIFKEMIENKDKE
jgi:hypothetical protein